MKGGKEVTNERSIEICERLNEITAELRDICKEIGGRIHILTSLNADGKTASTTYALKYRHDHFFEGDERLSYEQYTIRPEQVVFGYVPKGLETEIMMKEQKREKKNKK